MTIDIYIHHQHPLKEQLRSVLKAIAQSNGHLVAKGYHPGRYNIFAQNLPDDFLSWITPYCIKYGFTAENIYH